jgi:hypothetical protein
MNSTQLAAVFLEIATHEPYEIRIDENKGYAHNSHMDFYPEILYSDITPFPQYTLQDVRIYRNNSWATYVKKPIRVHLL